MTRFKSLFFIMMLMLLLSCSAGASYAESYHYAVTDMTFAEFYAGELGSTSSDISGMYDAVSTATQRFITRFTGFSAATSGDGSVFTGVKAVQVRMTDDVYNVLSQDTRYTFSNDAEFTEFKDVSTDGSFGRMSSDIISADGVTVSLSGGQTNRHGNYRLTISGLSYDQLGADLGTSNDKFLGATLETSDGTVYGLKPLHNLWIRGSLAEQMGFCVEDFAEGNGTHLSYTHTADLPGKTITKITYMLKNQPDIVISTDLYVKKWTDAAISVVGEVASGSNVSVHFTSSDIPDGAEYALASVAKVVGRTSTPLTEGTDYTYSGGVLTFTDLEAGNYTAAFSDSSETPYVDVTASFTAENFYYATTNMTYEEFYLAEIGSSALSLDAVSSATVGKAARFGVLSFDIVSQDGRNITRIDGLADVQVRMTEDVYALLSQDSRYNFSSDVFAEYKPVSPDGSFGAMVTELEEVEGASVSLSSGASTVWGNYLLTLSGVDDVDVSGKYLGAIIETSDGKKYAMQHLYNLFFRSTEMAFCVQELTEPHGNTPDYEHTNDLAGKTITKITYLLKNAADKYVLCSVDVPLISETTVTLSNDKVSSGTNVAIPLKFTDLPDGVTYTPVSVYSGSGRTRTPVEYTYTDGTLTLSGDIAAGNYTAVFHTDDGYTDIALTFYVEGPHYATTDMTWAEFYAGETGETSADLFSAGLDAVSSPTARIAGRFTQLLSADNSLGGADILGVKAVQVRMDEDIYQLLSRDSRYTFTTSAFTEYKDVNEDGSFGEMLTEYDEQNAVVTLRSGEGATWGNYMLNVTSIDISLGSGDTSDYLGVLITLSEDGKVYGLRHNSNLWFNAGDIALTYKEFVEPHGISRDYDYTSELAGKTITQIQYILKDKPDVVVPCSVYLKLQSSASVSVDYPAGYNALLAGTGDAVTFTFSGLSADVEYDLVSVTPTGRHQSALSEELYSYSDGKLSFDSTVSARSYRVLFETEKYSDLSAAIELFTTDATSLIVSDDNNGAALNFLLTPKGYIDAVDEVLENSKFVNASDYTHIPSNKTENYTAGVNEVSGSGFSFDIVLNDVSDDYTGIVGFGKIFTMNRTTLGTQYDAVYTAVNSIPVGESGWREIPKFSALNSAGLKAVQIMADGTSRDISSLAGTGAMIDGGNITLFYGVMAADSSSVTEGEYILSPEGETLINDGAHDSHIRVAIYIEGLGTGSSSSTPSEPSTPGAPDTPGNPSSPDVTPPESGDRPVNPNPQPEPDSGDRPVNPNPQPGPDSGDQPVNPNPQPEPDSGDRPVNPNPPTPPESGDQPVNPNPPTPTESGDRPVNPDTPDVPSAEPGESTLNLEDNSVVENIVSILRGLNSVIGQNTQVLQLPASASGSERTAADLSPEDLAAIPEGQTPAVILPLMRVDTAAVYVWLVDLSSLEVGEPIFLLMMEDTESASASGIYAAASGAGVCTFLDDAGNEVTTVPASKKVNAAAYMEPGKTYAPVITKRTSSSGDNTGGNTGGNEGGNTGTDTTTKDPGSSSGGCSTGLGLFVCAAALLVKKLCVK